MAPKFNKLNRLTLRKLSPGDKVSEHGITYEVLPNNDGRYSVNIMVDGQRIHRVIGLESAGVTREKAEQYLEQVRTEARQGRLNLPKGRKLPLGFEQAAEKYLKRLEEEGGKDIPKKRSRITLHLTPYFGNKPLSQLATFDIEKFKKSRKEVGAKPATINRDLAVLSHMLNKAEEWNWIDKKPCKVRLLKEENTKSVYLTPEQCARLLNAAKHDTNPQIYLFILIGLETAMRRSEIVSIRLENINTDTFTIFLPKAKAGARVQPITNNLAQYLKAHLQTLPKGQVWLFPTIGNMPSKSGHTLYVEDAFRRVVKAAKLDPKEITPHTLRHTATTHLVQAGIDVPTVQSITGHKTPSMVFRYAHTSGNQVRSALDKLEQRYQSGGTITQELHTPEKTRKTRSAQSRTTPKVAPIESWYPQGNSNPRRLREREVSNRQKPLRRGRNFFKVGHFVQKSDICRTFFEPLHHRTACG
jgi:integrase